MRGGGAEMELTKERGPWGLKACGEGQVRQVSCSMHRASITLGVLFVGLRSSLFFGVGAHDFWKLPGASIHEQLWVLCGH